MLMSNVIVYGDNTLKENKLRNIIDAILKLIAIALLIIGFLVIFKFAYEAITGEVLWK